MADITVVSPKTPCDLFAALAFSPTVGTAQPILIPSVQLQPPTPSSVFCTSSPRFPSIDQIPDAEEGESHRQLTSNEAKQLSLLLTQYLFPVRGSRKGLMSESIALAEKLHEAGIRWDKRRRVMGMHLRGIWEEGQRLGNAKVMGGHGPMDLYVQGSFLTIAEVPHPLDPMPIPIEVHPASIAALPKLTLRAGLASSLPAILPLDPELWSQADEPMSVQDEGNVAEGAIRKMKRHSENKRTWRDRKKSGLKIRTDGPSRGWTSSSSKSARLISPKSARSKKHNITFPRTSRNWINNFKKPPPAPDLLAVKSSRRVSIGGWEVR